MVVFRAVIKEENEVVNNSNSPQSDDELFIAVGASETWLFEMFLIYDSGISADIRFRFIIPTGSEITWNLPNATSNPKHEGDLLSRDGSGVGTVRGTTIAGILKVGSNSGTLQLEWAQNSAVVTDTTVHAGSTLTAHRT